MVYEVPSISRSPHDGPTTIRESADIFGRVASTSPKELIDKHGFQALPVAIDQAVAERIDETGVGYHPFYHNLVEYGARDTGRAVENLLPSRPIEERVESLRDHRTLMALGMMASRSEESMQNVIANDSDYLGARLKVVTDQEGKSYLSLLDESRFTPSMVEANKRTGCPFAVLNGDRLPSLPYVRFATWAGELMMRLDQLEYETRKNRGY